MPRLEARTGALKVKVWQRTFSIAALLGGVLVLLLHR